MAIFQLKSGQQLILRNATLDDASKFIEYLTIISTESEYFGVSVLKKYWGFGIATFLIKYLINWSKETIIKKINLRVREDNENAINLYYKLGFKNEGLISRYFLFKGKYYSSIMMGLEIN